LLESLETRQLLAAIELVELRDGGALDAQGIVLNSVVPQDRAGFSVSNAGDLNADGFDDLLIGAPVDFGFPAGTGQTYVVFGKAGGFQDVSLETMNAATGRAIFGIAAEDHAGFSVSSAGDVNGDGFHDFILGAPYADRLQALPGTGQAYVIFGGFTQTPVLSSLNGQNGFLLQGLVQFDRAGFAVRTAGDVNGDGFDDLLVGAPSDDYTRPSAIGTTYLLFGKGTPFTATVNLWELTGNSGFALAGLAAGDHLGAAVSTAGDINGDGFDDLVVGAPYADASGTGSGSAYVVFGGTNPARGLNVLNGANGFRLDGFIPFDRAGFSVSSAGDFNGDGFDDLLIGSPGDRDNPRDPFDGPNPTGPGQAYLVYGKASGFPASLNLGGLQATGSGFSILGIDGTATVFDGVDYAGFSVSGAGDVDGDGFDDLLIGAPYVDNATETGVGEAYLIFGRAGGFPNGLTLSTLTDDQGVRLLGDRQLDRAGYSVSAAGDVNGDGFDDLLIGAPTVFPYSGSSGRAYLLFGRDFRGKSPLMGDEDDNVLDGTAAANVILGGQAEDTLNGRGGADVLRGGEGADQLVISDVSFFKVDGGRGEDTLRLDGAGLLLDLTTIPDTRIKGIERIDITGSGNNELRIGSLLEVLNLSDTSNRLIVHRDRGDVVNIGAGWTEGAAQIIEGESFRVFQQGAGRLLVTNLPPELDLNGPDDGGIDFAAHFVEDAAPLAIVDGDLFINEQDNLTSATARISNLLDAANETLAVTVGSTGIQASYNSTTGVLSLTGARSAANYQQVLRTLTYRNVSQNPDTTGRLIEVAVSDGVFQSPTATATVTVEAVNDAPRVSFLPLPVLSAIQEDTTNPPGDTVESMIFNGTITDPDGPAVEAIAVISAAGANGTWQFSLGGEWIDFGAPSNSAARLLGPTNKIRFVPAPDFNGLAELTFRAWDQTMGLEGDVANTTVNGGVTPFSSAGVTAAVRVLAINDAPVLDAGASPMLSNIPEDNTNSSGNPVSGFIINGSITDVDGPAVGSIAIISVNNTNGRWEHSSNGTNWSTINATPAAALLLSTTRRVRFVPNPNFHGTATFDFRAWDESAGTDGGVADTSVHGGTTPFSAVTDTAQISVLAVDDLPTLASISRVVIPPTATTWEVMLSGISDGDEGLETVTVTAVSNNHSVLPDPVVDYAAGATTGKLTLSPVQGASGTVTVTVTVREEDGKSVQQSFQVFVGNNPKAWQNPLQPLDVDNNTFVVPLDALLIINELNLPKFIDAQQKLPIPPPEGKPPPYLDPSGDGFATALDVLLVINFLNAPGSGEGEARSSDPTLIAESRLWQEAQERWQRTEEPPGAWCTGQWAEAHAEGEPDSPMWSAATTPVAPHRGREKFFASYEARRGEFELDAELLSALDAWRFM